MKLLNWLFWQGRVPEWSKEKGAMNIGGIMMLGIGMVFLAVGFIFLPITTTATASLLAYAYTGGSSVNATAATYTGFTSVVGITPLLILVGFISAAVIVGMLGIKIMKGGSGRADPGSLMLLGLSIVFIGVGLIIEPVALDGISAAYDGVYASLSSYTGFGPVLLMAPMLVHLGFIAAAVLSGFFGIKRLSGSM